MRILLLVIGLMMGAYFCTRIPRLAGVMRKETAVLAYVDGKRVHSYVKNREKEMK